MKSETGSSHGEDTSEMRNIANSREPSADRDFQVLDGGKLVKKNTLGPNLKRAGKDARFKTKLANMEEKILTSLV